MIGLFELGLIVLIPSDTKTWGKLHVYIFAQDIGGWRCPNEQRTTPKRQCLWFLGV